MTNSGNDEPGIPAARLDPPPSGGDRITLAAVVLASLLGVVSVLSLGWIGRWGYGIVETYGGLGGGWAQILGLLALGAGAVVGGCLVGVARLLHRAARARWLVLAGVTLAILTAAVGTYSGSLEYNAASARAEHACDDPVGGALVSLARALEAGPLVRQDDRLTSSRSDGTCLVLVNFAHDAEIEAQIARIAAAQGWSRTDNHWLSPNGVRLTFQVIREPDSMPLVELQGRGTEGP
ncbi:MAG: hypothetical protein WCF36_17260 [Candidatus Nanopelagicales bacterium]